MILTIILIIIVFSVLVIAHEWGHFIVARRNGVKVEEFGIGFPPKLWGRMSRKGTLLSINALPIGGFVRLKGEDGQSKATDSFAVKKTWPKTKIILAGVAMNLLIAYGLLVFLLVVGMPPIVPTNLNQIGPFKASQTTTSPVTILAVNKNSAAQTAGIKVGDQVKAINNQNITTTAELQSATKELAGRQVTLSTITNKKDKLVTVTLGKDENVGYLGVAAQPLELVRYHPLQALGAGAILTVQLAWATIAAFGSFIVGLFTRAQVSQNVAGPIGIVSIFGSVVQFGWRYVLAFVATISLSLAVINALPIPALDGGRLIVILAQRAGVKITPKNEQWIHLAGFVFLIALVIIVSISDILRLFR